MVGNATAEITILFAIHQDRLPHFYLQTVAVTNMVNKGKKMTKRGFRPLLGLVSWWKGRKFYFAQQEDLEDDEKTARKDKNGIPQEQPSQANLQRSTNLNGTPVQQQLRYPFTRSLTVDSFQDSIESMDSVAESYWDPEDETSQTTTPASNTGYQPDFLVEHLGFLSAQTQPREVEVVYRK